LLGIHEQEPDRSSLFPGTNLDSGLDETVPEEVIFRSGEVGPAVLGNPARVIGVKVLSDFHGMIIIIIMRGSPCLQTL